jgi:gliding motility-associated-like protein
MIPSISNFQSGIINKKFFNFSSDIINFFNKLYLITIALYNFIKKLPEMKEIYFINIFIFLATFNSFADGTRQLRKTSSEKSCLQIYDQSNGVGPFRKFATYEADSNQRLYFTIYDFNNEAVFFGFNMLYYYDTVYFRIKDKQGNVVYNPAIVPKAGKGYINDYTEAVAGPNDNGMIPNPTGYNPFMFKPNANGDYYIEFNIGDSLIAVPEAKKKKHFFEFFDLSVVNKVQQKAVEGRVWSRAWDFSTQVASEEFTANLFIYADDGVITSVNFNGMKPHGFVVSSNQTGAKSSGNFFQNRQSVTGDSTYPQYKIFLTYPDSTVFIPGKLETLINIAPLKCFASQYCMNVTVSSAGSIEVLINLNGVPGYQSGTEDVVLDSNVTTGGTFCLPWNGLNGQGDSLPVNVPFDAIVTYKKGLTHLPLYDVEGHPNGYIVNLLVPEKRLLQLHWDDSQIPTGSQSLTGCIPDTLTGSGCHGWGINYTDPVPAQAPHDSVYFGDNKTINTWWYATLETDTITLIIPPSFYVQISSDHQTASPDTALLCPNTQIKLQPHLSLTDPSLTYYWTAPGNYSYTGLYPEFEKLKNDTEVTLTVTNPHTECYAKDSYTITVRDIVLPNLITPNNDKKNDAFEVMNLFPYTAIEVYDRWGNRLYKNENYDNSWGKDVNDGVYYFILNAKENCGTFKGWVEVIR